MLPREEDPVKAESARIFYAAYVRAQEYPTYQRKRAAYVARFG